MKIIPADVSWVNYKKSDILQITKKVKHLLAEYKKNVLKIGVKDLNFKNFIHLGEEVSFKIGRLDGVLFPFSNLHPDKSFRDTSMKVELELSKLLSEFAYDQDLYKQFVKYYTTNYQDEKNILNGEDRKVVEDQKKSYDKMGMGLSKGSKKKLLRLKNKITKLAQEFDKNTTKNYEIGLFLEKEELAGVPEEYLKSFKYDDKKKKYFVNCSGRDDLGTDYPILKKYCTNPKTREKITFLNESGVGEKNNKKLREILKLRSQIKDILGFKTWAHLSMDDEMMNDPKKVKNFLQELIKSLAPEFSKFRNKVADVLKKNDEKLSTASFAYGKKLLNDVEVEIKEDDYRPYFELETVLNVMFKTWEELFDVKTELVSGRTFFDKNAKFYKFTDAQTGNLLGHGIYDLHPRPGKFGHAGVANFFPKYTHPDRSREAALVYLICNFKKADNGPTFLSLSDMNTLYHEAGHLLHDILMQNNYISTSTVSRDFAEIPSQFHEGFLSDHNFISSNFRHYETGEKMSKLLIKNISKMNSRGESYSWVRTSLAALFDQEINSGNILNFVSNKTKIDDYFNQLYTKKMKIKITNKDMHFPSMWGHLVSWYNSKYYSYVISKVYAVDFWNEFSKGGIKKGAMSEKYKKFLEGANTKEEKVLVKEYLGREVNQKPFLDSLK